MERSAEQVDAPQAEQRREEVLAGRLLDLGVEDRVVIDLAVLRQQRDGVSTC